jgi:hypothetical protein
VLIKGTSGAAQQVFNLTQLSESIVRGYGTSVSRIAAGIGPGALVNLVIRYTDFDPATESSSNTGLGTGDVVADSSDVNDDPLFADTSFGDPDQFQLRVPSPAIDAGPPAEAGLSSPIDVVGAPRVVDGRNTGLPVADMGAFEYQPHAPSAEIDAPATATVGQPVTFGSPGSTDPDPGDVITFSWRFDDGADAVGANVSHAFTSLGTHHVTLIVTDLTGRVGTTAATVLVRPAITELRVSKQLVVTYLETSAVTTRFTIVDRHGHTVRSFNHGDHAGTNRFRLKRRGLRSGRYRLLAVPAGGATASTSFQIRQRR